MRCAKRNWREAPRCTLRHVIPIKDVVICQNVFSRLFQLRQLVGKSAGCLLVIVIPMCDELAAGVLTAEVSFGADQHSCAVMTYVSDVRFFVRNIKAYVSYARMFWN